MPFIGAKPATVPLTSTDLEDNIITSAKIVNGTITSTDMDLSGTYAFTGTVTGAGGVNTPSFLAKQSGVQSISANTTTKLNFQTEIFDTDSKFDNSTNYRFTPATAGKYFIFGQFSLTNMEDSKIQRCYIYKNGSFLDPAVFIELPGREEDQSCAVQIIDDANTTDYYELYVNHTCVVSKNTVTNSTFFGAYKIIE